MTAYILNLLDLAFTLHALRHGAVELNPLMRCVPIMVVYKTIVVFALCWWLRKRGETIARMGLLICALFYAIIDIYHIINIFGGGFVW